MNQIKKKYFVSCLLDKAMNRTLISYEATSPSDLMVLAVWLMAKGYGAFAWYSGLIMFLKEIFFKIN